MMRKYWSFEEPSDRVSRLKKMLLKHVKPGLDKELADASLLTLDYFFDMVFGGRPTDAASRVLSLCLARQDIARFEEIAFADWARHWGDDDEIGAPASAFWDSLKSWTGSLNYSPSQQKWLLRCALASPDWSKLQTAELWSGDERTRFFNEVLSGVRIILRQAQSARLEATVLNQCHVLLTQTLEDNRQRLPADFLPNAVLIVEGTTETLLLPHFAKLLGEDMSARAIMVVSAGGAKQIVKRYLTLRDLTTLPIFCLFDHDAAEEALIVQDSQRDKDYVHILQAGEIEDTFPITTFVQLLNNYFQTLPGSVPPVFAEDFPSGQQRKKALARVFKARHLGPFDKIAFAESIVENLDSEPQVPAEIAKLLRNCTNMVAQRVQ